MVHSLLKKVCSRFTACSKGFSTVIGTTSMVLIMLLLSTSVFLWSLSQITDSNQVVKNENQLEVDRLSEKVTASNVNYKVLKSTVLVEVKLKNEGPLPVQITTLWILDTTIKKYGFNNTLNLSLKPGEEIFCTGGKAINVEIKGANSTDKFTSWLVTARGNMIPLEKEKGVIVAQLAQGIGSLALNFSTFRYFTYATSTRLANYPDGIQSFNVPSRTYIAFGAVLTNLDPSNQTITLNLYSQVWLYFPKSPGQAFVFYIVNVASDGTITTPYSPITIAFGETKLIVFASDVAGGLTRVSIQSSVENLPCALNLLLLGKIGPRDYGQNIPFVSLYVYKP